MPVCVLRYFLFWIKAVAYVWKVNVKVVKDHAFESSQKFLWKFAFS